jgi:hypothetical protein
MKRLDFLFSRCPLRELFRQQGVANDPYLSGSAFWIVHHDVIEPSMTWRSSSGTKGRSGACCWMSRMRSATRCKSSAQTRLQLERQGFGSSIISVDTGYDYLRIVK